jgi:hypothetical protein
MNHLYRFKNHPLFQDISTSFEFKKLLALLASKKQQQRQEVIKLEHLMVDTHS